jgi:hypothetical protein
MNTIVQFDGFVWKIISVGVESETGVFCHLASVHSFCKTATGNVPHQISDVIPFRTLHLRHQS